MFKNKALQSNCYSNSRQLATKMVEIEVENCLKLGVLVPSSDVKTKSAELEDAKTIKEQPKN